MKKVLYSPKVAPYLFILPFILTVLIFWISPLVKSGIMSTQNIIPGSVENIGLRNYQRLFKDRLFFLALGNSVKYTIWTLIILIPVPLLLAVLINSKIGSDKFKSAAHRDRNLQEGGSLMTDEVTQVRRRRRLSRLTLTLLFVAIIVLAMIPFWAIFVATFQDGNMIVRYGLNLGIDLSTASLDNWIHLFTDSGSYFRWFFNSTILTVLQVVLTLFISAFVAYGFAMYEFRFDGCTTGRYYIDETQEVRSGSARGRHGRVRAERVPDRGQPARSGRYRLGHHAGPRGGSDRAQPVDVRRTARQVLHDHGRAVERAAPGQEGPDQGQRPPLRRHAQQAADRPDLRHRRP
jgi:ABC-type sugar transport system permease subunit